MKILYRDREAWLDPADQTEGLESQEREALSIFSAALPNVPASIDLADGIMSYGLTSTGKWADGTDPAMYAEYAWSTDVESPLPWPLPTEEQKGPGRATLVRIRRAADAALSNWESNDYAAVVQNLKEIEREAHDLIKPASQLIKNYMR